MENLDSIDKAWSVQRPFNEFDAPDSFNSKCNNSNPLDLFAQWSLPYFHFFGCLYSVRENYVEQYFLFWIELTVAHHWLATSTYPCLIQHKNPTSDATIKINMRSLCTLQTQYNKRKP
jgi:hypothetical protein